MNGLHRQHSRVPSFYHAIFRVLRHKRQIISRLRSLSPVVSGSTLLCSFRLTRCYSYLLSLIFFPYACASRGRLAIAARDRSPAPHAFAASLRIKARNALLNDISAGALACFSGNGEPRYRLVASRHELQQTYDVLLPPVTLSCALFARKHANRALQDLPRMDRVHRARARRKISGRACLNGIYHRRRGFLLGGRDSCAALLNNSHSASRGAALPHARLPLSPSAYAHLCIFLFT